MYIQIVTEKARKDQESGSTQVVRFMYDLFLGEEESVAIFGITILLR